MGKHESCTPRAPETVGRSTAARYGATLGFVALAFVVRAAVAPVLRDELVFVPFFVAIAAASWFGGLGPSRLSAVLGFILAEFLFASRDYTWRPATVHEVAVAVGYFASASIIVLLGQAIHKAREAAVARQLELERQIEDRITAEAALRKVRDELEIRIQERTCELNTAMEAQGRERQRFQDVFDMLPFCVFVLTSDHQVAFANRRFRDRYGEPNGHRCFESLFGKAAPCEFCESYRVLETGQPQKWERAGPNGRQYQIFASPYQNAAGSNLILSVEIDITEVKRSRAKIEEQAALLQLAHDAILVTDLSGKISFWNRGAEETYGWRSDEVIGGNAHELLRTVFPIPLDKITALVQEQGEWEGELEHVARSGQKVIVASRWSGQRDESGKPSATLEINRDITHRKRAEEELTLNRQRLAVALKAGHSGTFEWDIKNNVNTWASETEELYGVATGMFGRDYESWENLVLPEDLESARAAVQDSLRTGEFQSEWRIRRPVDGQIRWLAARAKILFDAAGTPSKMVGVNEDITERKKAELSLAQRTAELMRSNAELQQFAYVASHDLQEPLRMVANFTQLLADRYGAQLDENAREFIGYAVEGATRMQRLIQDLLALSRVGTRGKNFEVVRLEEALDRAVANLQVAIRESGATVSHDALPLLLADPSQIVQLFQNLIANGIKFRSERPPQVLIGAVQAGNEWAFSVRDNGIGFEPRYAARVFEVFQRLHTREEYEGTGMGLAICRKIVERHHGRIWAESEPGSGSTFFFTIPAAASQAEPTSI